MILVAIGGYLLLGFAIAVAMARKYGAVWWGYFRYVDGFGSKVTYRLEMSTPKAVFGTLGIVVGWPFFVPGVVAGKVAYRAQMTRMSEARQLKAGADTPGEGM